MDTGAPNVEPAFPDCWLTVGATRELWCWGALDADPDAAIEVWRWFTGTDRTTELDQEERQALRAGTAVRPLVDAPAEARARLARHIGQRRLWSEGHRWGLWSVPVDELEAVLAIALTRSARSGRLRPPIVA